MVSRFFIALVLALVMLPVPVSAVEVAPALTDREIVERLTRLEEGLDAVRAEIGQVRGELNQLRGELNQLREELNQLREDMDRKFQRFREDTDRQFQRFREVTDRQFQRFREEMQTQFDRQFQLALALLGVFAALMGATIGFAVWDRRTMIRPFETRARSIEADIATSNQRLSALLEALRTLSQRNPEVAAVLKNLNF